MANNERDDGLLFAVAGQSRWGKSHWVKSRVRDAQRIICWDPRGEYIAEGFTVAKSLAELAAMLREIGTGQCRITYWGRLDSFNGWADLVYNFCQLWPCTIVIEEISDVTHAGKAHGHLGELIRKGLYYGNHIYAVTQKPQECSKTIWSNPSCIHTHGFIAPDDQAYMAKRLAVPVEVMADLQKYHWLERWEGEQEIIRGGGLE